MDQTQKLWHEAERSVLGGIIRTPNLIPQVTQKLAPEDFKDPRHQEFFQGIVRGWQEGQITDEISAGNYLLECGVLKSADDYQRVADLVGSARLPEQFMWHVDQVADNAVRWRIDRGARTLLQAYEAGAPVSDLLELAQTLTDTAIREGGSDARRLGESLEELLDEMEARANGELEDEGISSGIDDLDNITGGFKPGQLIIVAARPGVGKSTLGLDIMREASIRNNIPTLMFSLEMSEREVQERALSAEANVSITKVQRGELDERDWQKVTDAKSRIEASPIFIDDSPEITMIDISSKTKQQVQKNGIGMIVVDYLQLLKSGSRSESRQEEVSEFSRQLKLLAKSCGIPIIAVAQLNREVEKRGEDATPRASDLRESGSLEQDANIIIMIHRPDLLNSDCARSGEADLMVVKNRGGPTGTATVANMLQYSKFAQLA